MSLLDIEEERAGNRVLASRDGLEGRRDAINPGALDLVPILLQEAKAEDAEGLGVSLELLDDQVVVLASLDIGPVLAHAHADRLEALLVRLLHGLDQVKLLAASLHRQFGKGIAGAGGGGRAQDLDLDVGQGRIDVPPGLVGVRYQGAGAVRVGDVLG